MKTKNIQSAIAVGLGITAFAVTVPTAHAQEGLEQVFVTARKRDEGVQTVPIAMVALSGEALDQRGVREIQDLNTSVPGFRFGAQGGKGNTDVVLRGLSRIPVGEGMPAVVTYFANVALPGRGSNVPTFDLANIQVLKGPQGTLFGRNTLGGAVVIAPVAPSYEFGGYIRGAYGTKDYRNLEGAINVPIVDEKVALRIAGQIRRQDGFIKNLSKDQVNAAGERIGGDDFQNIHQNSYRISLLVQPTENIENTFVYDHLTAPENASGGYIFRTTPFLDSGAFAGLINGGVAAQTQALVDAGFGIAPTLNGGDQLAAQLRQYAAGGQAAGYHASYTDLVGGGYSRRNLEGFSNDTSWNMGWATLRNIFGYRKIHVAESIASGSTGPLSIDLSATVPGLSAPFALFDASQVVGRKYVSDEVQLFGTAFDDKLEWITGYYWNHDESTEPNGSTFVAFGAPGAPVTAHQEGRNWAVFAQGGYDLSDLLLDGLKFNLGARYSVDKLTACGGSDLSASPAILGAGECNDLANAGSLGWGKTSTGNYEYSYTAGLDWQINPDTLVYVTTRRGYRAANINTPIFNTPYTNGDPAGCSHVDPDTFALSTQCPDLRSLQKIDPETIKDVELGVKNDWAIGSVKGRVNAAAYYMKYEKAVQFINFQTAGIPGPFQPSSGSVGVNAADLTIKGIELDLTIIPIDSVVITLSGAFTDQKVDKVSVPDVGAAPYTEDNVTLPSPRKSGSVAAAWTLPFQALDGDIVLNGDYYYTSPFGGQDGENQPGYSLTNFRVSWNGIAKSGVDLAAYVKNVFDKDYYQSPIVMLSSFPVNAMIAGDPRTWGVEATYKF